MSNEITLAQMKDILDGFDFDKLERVMEVANWKWLDHVPTKARLYEAAVGMLFHVAVAQSDSSLTSGGFVAEKKDGQLSLTFIFDSVTIRYH